MNNVEDFTSKARKYSVAYVFFASMYILMSDLLVPSFSVDAQTTAYIQITKGLLFVFITGFLLYGLLARFTRTLEDKQEELGKSKTKVHEQRELFKAIIDQTDAIIYVKDADGKILMVNEAYLDLFDITRNDIIGNNESVIYDENLLGQIRKNDREVLQKGKPMEFEEQIEVNGETRYYQTIKYPLKGVPNYEGCLCGISTDITDKKRTMFKLRERTKEQACLYKISELAESDHSIDELLSEAVSYLPAGWQYPEITEAKITFEGREFTTKGFQQSEHRLSVINEDIEGKTLEVVVVYLDDNNDWGEDPFLEEERELIRAIGHTLITKLDRLLTIQELQSSLEEKKVLLQEIHHRVKNNLAVVSGLLQLQRFKLNDEYYNEILQSSEMRIKTMGLVHDKLYQSSSLSSIDFGSYIEDLVTTLNHTFSFEDKIEVSVSSDSIELNINQAIPSALILNELITNAAKHAFPDGKGNIVISIRQDEENRVSVSIADDGVGIPEEVNVKETNSMGYTIVNTLIRQLSADLTVESSSEGTTISFEFTKKSLKGSSSNIDQ